jgi:hypothetical protein
MIVVPLANMMYNHYGGLDARRSMFMPKRPCVVGWISSLGFLKGEIGWRTEMKRRGRNMNY